MGSSFARTLVVMGGKDGADEAMHIDRRPVVYSLLTGGLMMMAIEAIVAAAAEPAHEPWRPCRFDRPHVPISSPGGRERRCMLSLSDR